MFALLPSILTFSEYIYIVRSSRIVWLLILDNPVYSVTCLKNLIAAT